MGSVTRKKNRTQLSLVDSNSIGLIWLYYWALFRTASKHQTRTRDHNALPGNRRLPPRGEDLIISDSRENGFGERRSFREDTNHHSAVRHQLTIWCELRSSLLCDMQFILDSESQCHLGAKLGSRSNTLLMLTRFLLQCTNNAPLEGILLIHGLQ